MREAVGMREEKQIKKEEKIAVTEVKVKKEIQRDLIAVLTN